MKKINMVAIAVWGTALIAAGAFAYVLGADAPQPVASNVDSVPNELISAVPFAEAAMHRETGLVIVLPPTVIASPPHRQAVPPTPPRARELSEMNCTAWRALEQGDQSQQVRSCD